MAKKHDDFINDGYRVVGPCTADGSLWCWYFPDLLSAQRFAKSLAADAAARVIVCKFVGSYAPQVPPPEWIDADPEKETKKVAE